MMKEIKEIKCGNCGTKITEEQMNLVEMDVKAKGKDGCQNRKFWGMR